MGQASAHNGWRMYWGDGWAFLVTRWPKWPGDHTLPVHSRQALPGVPTRTPQDGHRTKGVSEPHQHPTTPPSDLTSSEHTTPSTTHCPHCHTSATHPATHAHTRILEVRHNCGCTR